MVNKAAAVGTLLVACAIVGGATLYSTSDVNDPRSPVKIDIEKTLLALVSYPDEHLYERTQFKVLVLDYRTELPIEKANVSFMIPETYHLTNSKGYVHFTAPYISKATSPHIRTEYIRSPGDTNCSFNISVKKAGYRNYSKTIVVHIREDLS